MISALAPFLAGLGLFFTGVHFIADNLTPLVGRRFRQALGRMSSNPWKAGLAGMLAGAVTQSSSAVSYITMGLVGANAIDLRKAILIPTWSHVGTVALVALVAVDFGVAASYVLAIAGAGIYFGLVESDRSRNVLNILLGAGLLFFGLGILRSGAGPLRDFLIDQGVMDFIARGTWLSILFGTALTVVGQPTLVVGAIAVMAVNVGVISFHDACWMIYGANVGSAFNHYLVAFHYQGENRQIMLMQSVQKLGGLVGVVPAVVAGAILQQPLIESAASLVSAAPAARVAVVFFAYQLIGAIVCTVAFEPLLRMLERWAPRSPFQELSKAKFLLDDAVVDPSLAIELVAKEEGRLTQWLPIMLDEVRSEAVVGASKPDVLCAASHSVAKLMTSYLEGILEANLDRADRERVIRLQHRTANLEALFDSLDEFRHAAREAQRWPASGRVAQNMIEALHALLLALVDATISDDTTDRDLLLRLLGARDELMERTRQRVLRENPDLPAKAQEALFSVTMLFERIVWLARRTTLLLSPPDVVPAEQDPA